jgi:hypothetical protein
MIVREDIGRNSIAERGTKKMMQVHEKKSERSKGKNT